MTIKGFHGKKLTLTRKRDFTRKHDNLTLKRGNKVLCTFHVAEDWIHIFPEPYKGGGTFVPFK